MSYRACNLIKKKQQTKQQQENKRINGVSKTN